MKAKQHNNPSSICLIFTW